MYSFWGHLAIQLLGHLILACKVATTHELVQYGIIRIPIHFRSTKRMTNW